MSFATISMTKRSFKITSAPVHKILVFRNNLTRNIAPGGNW